MRPPLDRVWEAIKLETCTVVDIGARGGIDGRWRRLGPHLRLVGFEPDPEECERLNDAAVADPRTTFLNTALSDRAQEMTLHLCRSPGSSSCYRPKRAFVTRFPEVDRFDVVGEIRVAARTLDEALKDGAPIDFVKLDTQGSEFDIISGGPARMAESFGVEVEAEFSAVYDRQPLFADIDRALRGLGFTLFDLRPCYWKRTTEPCRGSGQIMWADALYLKDPIASGVLPLNPAAALATCILYGKVDFAIELAAYFASRGVYRAAEHARLLPLLRDTAAGSSFGRVRGTGRLAALARIIADRFHEAHWGRYEFWRF